jgi:hypothetical protein
VDAATSRIYTALSRELPGRWTMTLAKLEYGNQNVIDVSVRDVFIEL